MQIAKLRILKTTAFDHYTNDVQFVNDERWKITGIHLKFVYSVKLLSNR